MEAPEVLFYDIGRAKVNGFRTVVEIDPWFVDVCEPGTLKVLGPCADRAAIVGGRIQGGNAIIETVWIPWMKPEFVDFQIVGVRKGFKGMRFPLRDKEQFEANERHLNSAYPAKDFSNFKRK